METPEKYFFIENEIRELYKFSDLYLDYQKSVCMIFPDVEQYLFMLGVEIMCSIQIYMEQLVWRIM